MKITERLKDAYQQIKNLPSGSHFLAQEQLISEYQGLANTYALEMAELLERIHFLIDSPLLDIVDGDINKWRSDFERFQNPEQK